MATRWYTSSRAIDESAVTELVPRAVHSRRIWIDVPGVRGRRDAPAGRGRLSWRRARGEGQKSSASEKGAAEGHYKGSRGGELLAGA
jgi:hypothetical protein